MNLLPWLSLSSDLNPTENEWGELKRSINMALSIWRIWRDSVWRKWSLISYQVFSKLFRHYRRKLRAVTLGKGRCNNHTWSDVLGSTSGTIFRSVARLCAGSLIAAGNGSPSSVGSGWCSAPRGDGGLGSGSGVDLARSSSGETVRGDPFLTRVHSTKAAKSSRTIFGCTRCSGLHHRMRGVRHPGSWWCELTKGIVLYGPRAIVPPAPAGGGGISVEGGDP